MASRWFLVAAAALSLTGPPFDGETLRFPIQVVHRGELTHDDYERVIEQPFIVPPGAARLEISLSQTGADERTVIDLGLRSPTGLRGWSGGRETHINVSPLTATPGYLPGAIEPGEWAVLIGVPNIRPGRRDRYELMIVVDDEALLPTRVIDTKPGWYTGDLHTHSGHSDGRTLSLAGTRVPAPPHRVFERARAAGLNFVLLSDHNTASHWLDVDRLQPYFDDLLMLHGREITTYRGHANTAGERAFLPFHLPSPAATPSVVLTPIARAGAFLSINHPHLPDDERCMGCGWTDRRADVIAQVHGVEVINGDTRTGSHWGWTFWADLLNAGHRLTAVGGSDDHTPDDLVDRAPGVPTTVVWAQELSENAIVEGLKSGRVYVRALGPAGPHLDLSADVDGVVYSMGARIDAARARDLALSLDLQRASGLEVVWVRNGAVAATSRVTSDRAQWRTSASPGDWFSVLLRRGDQVVAISNAIYFGSRRVR